MKNEELIRFSKINLYAKNKVKGPSLLLLLLLIGILLLVALPKIPIEISSQARGIIRPQTDNSPIMAYQSGRILSLPIENNQSIHKGDLILELDAQDLDNLILQEESFLQKCLLFQDDIKILLNNTNPKPRSSEFQEDFFHFSLQKKELETKIGAHKILFNRQNTLFQEKVIPQAEWEKAAYELNQSQEALESFIQQKKKEWAFLLQKEVAQEKSYRTNLKKYQIEKKNKKLFAPMSGTITQFIGLKPGSFLPAGIEIARISPDDSLIIEALVSPKDIGLIHLGQSQKIAIDAFNYRQWGWLEAEVIEINRNPFQENNAYFFKVRSRITQNKLKLKNGTVVKAEKGMTLTAHYFLSKRSLFNLLTDKIDDWFNPHNSLENGFHKN